MSTAQDLPVPLGGAQAAPALRLVPAEPLDFDQAVRSVRPRLHRYAIRRLGDVHEAEELVQEALLRAYSHRHQLLTEDDLAAWTTVVTGRLVIDRLRVRGRSTSVADVPEGARVGRDTADVVVARDEARMALDALDAMPSRQAALLWAREVEGQTYEELCRRFAMTEPAVRSVLTRARKALRKEYSSRGGTLPAGGLAVLAPWLVGLTWAEKLRRAAARVVAPTALGTAGIATLGGLMLSPFGIVPDSQARMPFSPAQAVVQGRDQVPHGAPLPQHPSLGAAALKQHPGTTQRVSALPPTARELVESCYNDVDSSGQARSIAIGGATIGPASAGDGRCDRAESVSGSTVTVTAPSPLQPYLPGQTSVTTDKVDCTAMPTNPVAACESPAPEGATR